MKIKFFLKVVRDCNLLTFLKYNYFNKSVIRKKGGYLYPFKGSIVIIDPTARLELNGLLEFNAGKYKGSRAESYLILDKKSIMSVKADTKINYNSTIHVNEGAVLDIGSMTTNVGINFQIKKTVKIGTDCMFGRNSAVFDSSFHPTGFSVETMGTNSEDVIVGNHVWIGAYSFVMQGSVIGDGSIIGTRAFIRGRVEPASTVMLMSNTPVSNGMMWSRDESKDNREKAYSYYNKNVDVAIIDSAVEKYGSRVEYVLSKALEHSEYWEKCNLIEEGLLDSLAIIKIVSSLNDEFKIKIPYYEIRPANFASKEAIATLIWRLVSFKSDDKYEQCCDKNLDLNNDEEYKIDADSKHKTPIVEQIYHNAIKYPDKTAIVSDCIEYSYSQLFDYIYGYCEYLKSLGLKQGDMILAKANQSINYIVTYFAAHLAGIEITTIEKNAPKDLLLERAMQVNAKTISTEINEFDECYKYIDSFDVLNHAVSSKQRNFCFPKETDLAEVIFTTGTTGDSKGIELSHRAVVCGAENMAIGAHMGRNTFLICPNPLSHSNAIKNLSAVMISGGTFYILDGLSDLNALFESMYYSTNKVSMVLPPSGLRTILKLAKEDFSKAAEKLDYLMIATAPLLESDKEILRSMFPNVKLYNHYGCSESSTISIYDFNKYKELKNCVGIATPNTNVMFVDDNRNVINSSKDNMGLLAVSGGTVMSRYFNCSEEICGDFVDGIVYTKDIGYIDENGFIFIFGRNDDILNVGGLKVSPLEVESVVMEFEGVQECICIGVSDDIYGCALKMLIVPTDGTHINREKLMAYISAKLERYKVPHLYEEVESIEKTYNGKINRRFYRNS